MREPNVHTDTSEGNGAPAPGPGETADRKELNVRSEEVQQIIGRPPPWLIRWGVSVFFGVLLLVLAAAWFIHYPEVVPATLSLVADPAPLHIDSPAGGSLRLLAGNQADVALGQELARVEDGSGSDQVMNAPIAGQLHYVDWLREGERVEQGQALFVIESALAVYYGHLEIPQTSFGKVSRGQPVLIRFESYPSHEFGSIMGRLDEVSTLPTAEGLFPGRVRLPDSLVTDYGHVITATSGMRGQAEIITDDKQLLDRIYSNLTRGLQ